MNQPQHDAVSFSSPHLEAEYRRWVHLAGADEEQHTPDTISTLEVLRAHFSILDYFIENETNGIGGIGPKDINLLQSAVARQRAGYGNDLKYPDKFDRVATLFYGLIKNHPFHDANKRTALLVALFNLHKLGLVSSASQNELERLAVRTADNQLTEYKKYKRMPSVSEADVCFIGAFFRSHTRRLDRTRRTITFRQLDTVLRRYDFQLVNPNGNYIDVVRLTEQSHGFLWRKKTRTEKRIAQVGFPGWKSQVSDGAMKSIRKETGLTSENGYDSKVLFDGFDAVESLIDQYAVPLRRLARK